MSVSVTEEAATQLTAYLVRVENLEREIDALDLQKKDVYAEVRAAGLCKRTLRALVAHRRRERVARSNTVEVPLLDAYRTLVMQVERATRV